MAEPLPCVELEPDGAADASVIWLHGLGADGNDFVPIVPHLGLDPAARVRFVFPHAPAIPVTINGGFVMPAWYDILEMNLGRRVDADGVLRSTAAVTDLIAREHTRGVPSERIVLAGFSQGGAIALHAALRHEEPLAGVLALSTYLVRDDTLEAERHAINDSTPIFQAHGTHDPVVPLKAGQQARDRLTALGYEVSWHDYPMQHEVCMEEIAAIGAFLGSRLGAQRA